MKIQISLSKEAPGAKKHVTPEEKKKQEGMVAKQKAKIAIIEKQEKTLLQKIATATDPARKAVMQKALRAHRANKIMARVVLATKIAALAAMVVVIL